MATTASGLISFTFAVLTICISHFIVNTRTYYPTFTGLYKGLFWYHKYWIMTTVVLWYKIYKAYFMLSQAYALESKGCVFSCDCHLYFLNWNRIIMFTCAMKTVQKLFKCPVLPHIWPLYRCVNNNVQKFSSVCSCLYVLKSQYSLCGSIYVGTKIPIFTSWLPVCRY